MLLEETLILKTDLIHFNLIVLLEELKRMFLVLLELLKGIFHSSVHEEHAVLNE